MTRLKLKSGLSDPATADALRDIAFRGETELWRSWARQQLNRP